MFKDLMRTIFKKYLLIIPVLVCLLLSTNLNAQGVKQDTLSLVNQYQEEASNAIFIQDFDTAIISLRKAHSLATLSKNNLLKASIHISFAELQYNLNNYNAAISATIKANALLNKKENQVQISKANTIRALALIKTNNFLEAENYLKEGDKVYTKLNDEKNLARIIYAFGILELEKGNPQIAINYFEAAIPLFKSYKLEHLLAKTYLLESDALLKLEKSVNNLNQANIALERATIIIDLNSYHGLKIESLKVSSQIALRENNFTVAEEYFSQYIIKKDSIHIVYINTISKSLSFESNVGDLNEIIATQQSDLDEKQKSINFGKVTTGLSVALIIILSLLALSLFKNNNLRAKANDLLKDKNVELTLAKEKAERASLAKAQFLSTITHELRTPLYAVTGLTHLLLEENPKPDQKEHLNSLKFSGEYLLSLINNILDLNKLEANKVEIEKTTFSLKKRINDVLVALKKTAEDRKNSLHFEYDDTIPEKLIGDPLKLSQVLINLIGNSVKFTQNGKVTIRVNTIKSTDDKVNLRVEIEDNGVGISKKKQKSIFETFNQGSLQINRKFGGSGLGLSIVKNLLELMNSKIYLESTLGKGSKFWFDISFNISEKSDNELGTENVKYKIDYAALENVSILVVEDNKINQMITKKILEKNKMVCLVADNGLDAIKMVHENNFELILMDIHMPGISGIETTQRIRGFNKQLPIIALTVVTIDENLDEFYKAGFNEIIPKPFKPEDFFEKIYRTLEASKSSIN